MPVSIPKGQSWSGANVRFSTPDEHDAMVGGATFNIMDATTWRNEVGSGEHDTAAFLVVIEGFDEPFVWTRSLTASRQKLVDLARATANDNDYVGPCKVVAIPSKEKGKSPFLYVTNADDERDYTKAFGNDDDEIPF